MYPGVLQLFGFHVGDTLVDIGTGRGELLAVAVEKGAERAIGFEYSFAALALARKTLQARGAGSRAAVVAADARAIPLPDGFADLVTLLDVVEHLTPEELAQTLAEAYRILRPAGRVVIHTFPTRTVYNVTYRVQRLLRRHRRRNWPADPRSEAEQLMHVNEQTVRSMRRALTRAGFRAVKSRLGLWIHTEHIPEERAKRIYRLLAKVPVLSRLAIADVWGEGVRPAQTV
jgi:cyclopropane fatty-acyl-phospholipid synthase-like methyltransferase